MIVGPGIDWSEGASPRPWHVGVFISGHNAESFEHAEHVEGDADGHVISGSVLRFQAMSTPLAPVQARVAHGCSVATAAAMLRKMADLIERAPEVLSGEPGWQVRRERDGGVARRRVTIEGLRAVAEDLDPGLRAWLLSRLDEIGPAIGDAGGPEQG